MNCEERNNHPMRNDLCRLDSEPKLVQHDSLLLLKCKVRDYIVSCKAHVSETTFFKECGFTDEIIQQFELGYDPEICCAVIPFGSSYYVARNVNIGAEQTNQCSHRPKGLKQPLFNLSSLSRLPEKVVFITETPLDAISIVQCGGNAIALDRCSIVTLGRALDIYNPQCQFVLAFNQDEPGQQAHKTVQKMIEDRGLSCSTPLHPVFTQYKNVNAILINEPDTLRDAVKQEQEHNLSLF